MGDIFGDIFGDLFGGGRSRRNDGPMKGANLRTAVRITFDESVKGCEKELKLNLKDPLSKLSWLRCKARNFSYYLSEMSGTRPDYNHTAVNVWYGS